MKRGIGLVFDMNAIAAGSNVNRSSILLVLNGLLEAEQNSLFRDMSAHMPYLGPAAPAVRRRLVEIADTSQQHARELAQLVFDLGGDPAPRGIVREEQFLGYLSIKFLVPRLIESRVQIVKRYEEALAALKAGPEDIRTVIERQGAKNREQLEALQSAR